MTALRPTPSSSSDAKLVRSTDDFDRLRFDAAGLIPVVAQDESDGTVLMVAWANRDALALTLETGFLHFWSRSRHELWKKGETSGNVLELISLLPDCDADTLLAVVRPAGPACHTGARACFDHAPQHQLDRLWETLRQRAADRPAGSYTTRLLDDANLRHKKLGEETTELVVALATDRRDEAAGEAADLLYHLQAALLGAGVGWDEVLAVLRSRE